jgi:hypothetical protein
VVELVTGAVLETVVELVTGAVWETAVEWAIEETFLIARAELVTAAVFPVSVAPIRVSVFPTGAEQAQVIVL